MPEPISEQIAALVKTRLDAITVANSYAVAADVQRPTRLGGYDPGHFAVDVAQGDITENEELSHPGNPPAQAWDMPFEIKAAIRSSENDTTAKTTFKNRFGADLVKALHNAANWWNWGGLAINSHLTALEDYESDDGEPGVRAILTIQFRTDADDPYTSRA